MLSAGCRCPRIVSESSRALAAGNGCSAPSILDAYLSCACRRRPQIACRAKAFHGVRLHLSVLWEALSGELVLELCEQLGTRSRTRSKSQEASSVWLWNG